MQENILNSDLSPEVLDRLRESALAAAEHAYAPYSGFRVGAALLLADDEELERIVIGCNVENASYRLTTCAEQTAIVTAVALYGPEIRIRAVAVANLNGAASQPCGACRQTIAEFSTRETQILFPGQDGRLESISMIDLLPSAFSLSREPVV